METPARHEKLRVSAPAALGGALLVMAVWGIVQLWGLEKAPFHTKGEPREALVVWEMVHGGGWVLPRRNGTEVPSKPPLFHWLGALASTADGTVSEWSIRLPSAVLSGASVLVVYLLGVTLFGPRAALISGLALLTSFEWQRAATSARVDMTLTFGLILALAGLLLLRRRDASRHRALVYIGLIWATLSKGPIVGLMLPSVIVLGACAFEHNLVLLRRLRPLWALPIVIVPIGAWYALALRAGGESFFARQIVFENIERIFGDARYGGGHQHSVGYLAGMLAAGLLPWTLFVLPAFASFFLQTLRALLASRGTAHRAAPSALLVVWILVVFASYSVPTSKRGVYLLALYPAAFLLLGAWWDAILSGSTHGLTRRLTEDGTLPGRIARGLLTVLAVLGAATLAVLGIAIASEPAGFPIFGSAATLSKGDDAAQIRALGVMARDHTAPLLALLGGAALAAALAGLAARSRRWGSLFAALVITVGAVAFAVQNFILPAIAEQKSRQAFVGAVRQVIRDPGELYSFRRFDYGMAYYWRGRIPVYEGTLSSEGPLYLLMSEKDWVGLAHRQRTVYERVPFLRSTRAGNLGRMVLTIRAVPARSNGRPASDRAPARGPS